MRATTNRIFLAGSYYTLKNNFSAKLLLNNKGPLPIEVQPTFFSMSGDRFEAPSVVVDGNTHQFLDLADSVAAAGQQFQEGSVQLFHRGKDLVLGAQIYLTDDRHSLSFEEKLSEPATSTSSGLAGVWWLPSTKGAVDLVISNTTDAAFSVSTKIRGEARSWKPAPAFSVKESFSNLSTNSCGNGNPVPSSCAAADTGGQFLDTMAVSGNLCNSGISQSSGCGFTVNSTWSICSGTTQNAIWRSTRETRSNSIKVNGQSSQYQPGTYLYP